jgi:hypothetical protein
MVAQALWRVSWWVSELQIRFHRILVLFSLGLLVLAWLPGLAARAPDPPAATVALLTTSDDGGHCGCGAN